MYTGEVVALSEQQLIGCDHAKPYEDAVRVAARTPILFSRSEMGWALQDG